MVYWFQVAVLALFWGGSYLAIRFAVEGAPPLATAATRIVICGILVSFPFFLKRRGRFPVQTRIEAMLAGVFMMGIPWALLFWAERRVLPSLAALTVSSMPIFTLLFAPLVTPSERHSAKQWAWVLVGFLGVFLLIWPSLQSPDRSQLGTTLTVLAVSASYALGTLGVRRLKEMPIDANLFYQCLGSLSLLIPLTLLLERVTLGEWSFKVWSSLLYLGIFSTFIAWLIYFSMIRRYGSLMASVIPYFVPVVSLVLDGIFLKELPHFLSIVGGIVILIGVYGTQRATRPS